jgi:Na+/citrate or Na+/malate symporter
MSKVNTSVVKEVEKVESKSKWKSKKIYGMPVYIFAFFAVFTLIAAMMEVIPNQIGGAVALLFTLGIIFGELGERIPIWNKYCGGGAILAFIVSGVLAHNQLIPQSSIDIAHGWMKGYSFLNLFIAFLIVGSLLGLNRKLLIRSSMVYLPTIIVGVICAGIFGVVGGLIFGITPIEILTAYVLPIMGGGAGAGAIPMAQIYEDVTGIDSSGYLSFALAILAVANIMAVLFAVALDVIGNAFPRFTGRGELVKVKSSNQEIEKEVEVKITMDEIAAAIFITAALYVFAIFFSKVILPSVFGVSIPSFAYLIIFAAMANVLNLIPQELKTACQKCQIFCGRKLIWIQMVGVGLVLINFEQMLSVLTVGNIVIIFMIILGAVVGTGVFGSLFGFYSVESSITAGLCMANMGGAGDLAVLGAAKRMELMSYAQISSRIGGAVVMLIGSVIFSFL